MVEACHNLACCHHSAKDAYLRLHAKTHQLMQYYICHKFGVLKEYNTYSQHPWHGTGQGVADAALWYIVLSDILIDAYYTKIAPHMLHDPMTLIQIQHSLKAFIDDVVLHATSPHDAPLQNLQYQAKKNLMVESAHPSNWGRT